jgi:ATP-dependent RNA helicase SUPV3L1/SUV3
MDYYAIAERLLRKGKKARAFELYKKTPEYQIRLDNKAAEIQSVFESHRNQRILSLVESDNLPDIDAVIHKAVENTKQAIETGTLLIEPDKMVYNCTKLNEMQPFDALNVLNRPGLRYIVYIQPPEQYSYKCIHDKMGELAQTAWIALYKEINPFKKRDKNLMNRDGEMVTVEEALIQRYEPTRKTIITTATELLTNEIIIKSIFANKEYAYLHDALIYRDTLRQMMSEKIPSDYTMFYPMARTMHRHFILHIGPTNSGKTYDAIADLMSARNGVYLAPLRLLALENQEKMNDNGVPCNLYTGEEQIVVEGAKHTSSTIETLSINQKYDVAVIDEAQLISDDQRGWAWTRAILGVRANVVHVCMSSDAERIVKKLIDMCGDSYEVVTHQRTTPLVVDTKLFDFPRDVQRHDALIVFSRRSVWDVASELEHRKIKASVIYGALPPSVRREEVRKFIEGETSVVVATDAIGMGLNLPIQRIVFLETEKFDGQIRRPLNHSEYKQIAGRAGRLGIFDVGHVATTYARKTLNGNINKAYEDIEYANILFPESLLTLDSPLIDILKMWKEIACVDTFRKANIEKEILLCKLLDDSNIKMPKREMLSRIQIPFNHEDQGLLALWLNLIIKEHENRLDLQKYVLPKGNFADKIQDLEWKYKECDLIFSFAKTIGSNDQILERIMDAKREISDTIIAKLKENKKNNGKKCKSCKKPLPFGFQYGYCERCYNEMNWHRNWYGDDWY